MPLDSDTQLTTTPTVLYLSDCRANFLVLHGLLQQRERSPLIQEAFTSDDELEPHARRGGSRAQKLSRLQPEITLSCPLRMARPNRRPPLRGRLASGHLGSSQTVVMGARLSTPLCTRWSFNRDCCSILQRESGENCRG